MRLLHQSIKARTFLPGEKGDEKRTQHRGLKPKINNSIANIVLKPTILGEQDGHSNMSWECSDVRVATACINDDDSSRLVQRTPRKIIIANKTSNNGGKSKSLNW